MVRKELNVTQEPSPSEYMCSGESYRKLEI